MAAPKKNIKTVSDAAVTPANTFAADAALAIQAAFKDAPEFRSALESELKTLADTLTQIHEHYLKKEVATTSEKLAEAQKNFELACIDVDMLKTTVLRMAVSQYGN
jgi:hypothetical protein